MTRRRRRAILAAVVGILILGAAALHGLASTTEVEVAASESISSVAAANPGATLVLLPGRHRAFELTDAVTVRGGPGVEVAAPVVVAGDHARLEDLTVVGGRCERPTDPGCNGVTVREVDGVLLDGVRVRGAPLHGIEVVDASARIVGCDVSGLGTHGQGIEVRHAGGRPHTVIERCRVTGGMEGITSHVSRVEVMANHVRATTRRGIAITEMSEAVVAANTVEDATGVGVLCADMSHCEIVGNAIRDVRADGSGVASRSGQAALAWYYSSMRLRDNDIDVVAADPVATHLGSTTTDRFPLGVWPRGWRGLLPAIPYGLVALALVALVRFAVVPALRRLPRRATDRRERPLATAALVGGFVVQTFHMVEHGVQVWQVHAADAEVRAGLVGQSFDTEWLHFGFNVGVLVLLAVFWRHARAAGGVFSGARSGAAWLAAAIVIQGYHVVEHTAKLLQHVATGVRIAPGLIGDDIGLVWFHYAINLAVYAGTAVAAWQFTRAGSGLVGAARRLLGTTRPQMT